jgi:predicted nucleic acid-binding protein
LTVVVVDASIAAAWFLPDEENNLADRVMEGLGADPGRAPALFWFETRALFILAERRGRLRTGEAATVMAELRRFPIVDSWDGDDGVIIPLAGRRGLTGYDAAYLALALAERLPLATLGRRLAAAAREERVRVLGPAGALS